MSFIHVENVNAAHAAKSYQLSEQTCSFYERQTTESGCWVGRQLLAV